jgi:hypothetical protein
VHVTHGKGPLWAFPKDLWYHQRPVKGGVVHAEKRGDVLAGLAFVDLLACVLDLLRGEFQKHGDRNLLTDETFTRLFCPETALCGGTPALTLPRALELAQ